MIKRILLVAALLQALVWSRALAGLAPAATSVETIVFSEVERRIIKEYFEALRGKPRGNPAAARSGKSGELPPGLARMDSLPPGLAKQVVERGTLPPGLARRDLPSDLALRLPLPRPGTKRLIVGDDVVLIRAATRTILDILLAAAKAG